MSAALVKHIDDAIQYIENEKKNNPMASKIFKMDGSVDVDFMKKVLHEMDNIDCKYGNSYLEPLVSEYLDELLIKNKNEINALKVIWYNWSRNRQIPDYALNTNSLLSKLKRKKSISLFDPYSVKFIKEYEECHFGRKKTFSENFHHLIFESPRVSRRRRRKCKSKSRRRRS